MSTQLPILPVTPAISQGFNPNVLQIARFDIPVSIVTTLFTTPQSLIKAISGCIIFPLFVSTIRNGAPYATAPGVLRLVYSNLNTTLVLTAMSAAKLTSAGTPGTDASYINAAWAGGGTGEQAGNFSGDLQLGAATGNPTVNGGSPGSVVTVVLGYYVVPVILSKVGSY